MTNNADLLSLKLHVADDGEVWYLNGCGSPTRTGLPVAGFLLHPLCREMPRIRIMGTHQNLLLILALYKQRLQEERGLLEVCGPMACKTAAERKDPSKVLYAMRLYERPTSVGGWHIFKKEDYMSYALASHLRKMGGKVDDYARRLLKAHPVWIPLSFISHLNEDACMKVLSLILDPRWFIDPMNPARGSRLRKYLGLDLKTMLGVMGEGPRQRYHTRCELVLAACKGECDKKPADKPNDFLWRIHRTALEKSGKITIANLRMTQMFIEYLRLCWLAVIGRGRHQNEALFVPDYFFTKKYETKAFYEHCMRASE